MSAPTIDTELLAHIDHLDEGAHASPEDGICVMEAVAWVAGESFSDAPQCACPVIAAYCRTLNDRMPDDQRQRLLPYIVRLAGSRSTAEVERLRGYKAATLAAKVFAPLALDARGLATHAATLRALPDITDLATARGARTAAAASYDAAVAYAYAAAEAAAAAAAGSAAYDYAAAAAAAGAAAGAAAAAVYAAAADPAAADPAASVWDAAFAGLDALLSITEEGHRGQEV